MSQIAKRDLLISEGYLYPKTVGTLNYELPEALDGRQMFRMHQQDFTGVPMLGANPPSTIAVFGGRLFQALMPVKSEGTATEHFSNGPVSRCVFPSWNTSLDKGGRPDRFPGTCFLPRSLKRVPRSHGKWVKRGVPLSSCNVRSLYIFRYNGV